MAVFLSTEAKNLIRSNFFGKDYDTYVNEINDQLILQFGNEFASNVVASEFGQVLVEMHAFALSTASWYGDRQADDTTLRYSRLRAAANVIARQLGYKPSAAVPSAITLTITLDFAPTTTRLTIERWRRLVGPGGLTYLTTEEVVFDVGETGPKTVGCIEGEVFEEIFTSDGTPKQFFLVETVPSDKSIAQDTPRAFVDTVEWTEQELLTYDRTNQFEIQYGFNPVRLQFGDGIAGNIPPKDTEIRLFYVATSGTDGAVQANTVTTFESPLVAGTQTISATLTHDEPSTPGSNRESIDSIRINAPLVTQTADRAVTQTDLDALINAFTDPVYGSVAIGRATVPRTVDEDAEALTIIALIESAGVTADVVTRLRDYWDSVLSSECKANVVNAQILGADSTGRYISASSGLARALETYLDGVSESTVKAIVTDGSINLYAVDLTVGINLSEGYDNEISRANVIAVAVKALEDELLGRSYGESLRISDLYAILDAPNETNTPALTSDERSLLSAAIVYSQVQISAINGSTPETGSLNSFGDLAIQDFEVITLGEQPVVSVI